MHSFTHFDECHFAQWTFILWNDTDTITLKLIYVYGHYWMLNKLKLIEQLTDLTVWSLNSFFEHYEHEQSQKSSDVWLYTESMISDSMVRRWDQMFNDRWEHEWWSSKWPSLGTNDLRAHSQWKRLYEPIFNNFSSIQIFLKFHWLHCMKVSPIIWIIRNYVHVGYKMK